MCNKNKFKSRRLELKLTLQEIADIVGVSKGTIQRYETGYIKNMKSDKVTLYAKALQVSPSFIMEDKYNAWDEKYNKDGSLSNEVKELENNSLPPLTPKDEREVAKALETILQDYDSQNSLAAYNDSDDEEDRELLRASLENTMRLAKRMAKKKFTPKKYRKE